MESPGLTWIPTSAGSLSYLVAHETGHQWFYGIVGNDQARQPYADEAATDFVARYVLGLRRASRCSTARLDLSIYRYSSACYYEDIYIQGGNFLDDTRRTMGSTAFWAGMRDYLARYRFKIAGTKTLLDVLDDHTPLNLVPRYEPRFSACTDGRGEPLAGTMGLRGSQPTDIRAERGWHVSRRHPHARQ